MFVYTEEGSDEENDEKRVVLPLGTELVDTTKNIQFNHASQTLIVSNIPKFIREPIPFGLILSCSIRRIISGMITKTLKFECTLQNEKRILANVIQIQMHKYAINASVKGQSLLAILSSNFIGSEFRLTSGVGKNSYELGYIEYAINILGLAGPRKMKVWLPKLNEYREPVPFYSGQKNLKQLYEEGNPNINMFQSKDPERDPVSGAYAMEFYGRAKLPSVKNFILRASEPLHFESLIFGRQSKTDFGMDVKYPLSLVQALSICISSTVKKIGVE